MEPLSQELDEYFRKCTDAYNAMVRRQNEVWGFNQHKQWSLRQDSGVLRLTFADGHVVEADAEIVGTVYGGSWEWAWNNPNIEERMKPSGPIFRTFGEKHRLDYYTTGTIPMLMDRQPNLFLSVTCDLAKAEGVFIEREGELTLCCLLRNIRNAAEPPQVEVAQRDASEKPRQAPVRKPRKAAKAAKARPKRTRQAMKAKPRRAGRQKPRRAGKRKHRQAKPTVRGRRR